MIVVRYGWIGVLFICLLPLLLLINGLFNNDLGPNPIETLISSTGEWGLRFLCLTLIVTPLRYIGLHFLAPFRRQFGLWAAAYSTLHFFLYCWLEQEGSISAIIDDIVMRPFIAVGILTLCLFMPLILTSHRKMVIKMGIQYWQALHRLVYLIALLALTHFILLVKKDMTMPLIYGGVIVSLLAIRLIRYGYRKNIQRRSA